MRQARRIRPARRRLPATPQGCLQLGMELADSFAGLDHGAHSVMRASVINNLTRGLEDGVELVNVVFWEIRIISRLGRPCKGLEFGSNWPSRFGAGTSSIWIVGRNEYVSV